MKILSKNLDSGSLKVSVDSRIEALSWIKDDKYRSSFLKVSVNCAIKYNEYKVEWL